APARAWTLPSSSPSSSLAVVEFEFAQHRRLPVAGADDRVAQQRGRQHRAVATSADAGDAQAGVEGDVALAAVLCQQLLRRGRVQGPAVELARVVDAQGHGLGAAALGARREGERTARRERVEVVAAATGVVLAEAGADV